jgi:transcriptional regulator with XRE-family HTH domain
MNKTVLEIGEKLRSSRELRGTSMTEISTTLKIRAKYLTALEEGNIAELPSQVYLIGYLKSYADFLGLDGNALVTEYKAEKEHRLLYPELYLPEPYRKDFHPKPIALTLSLVLAAGIYGAWYYYHHKNSAEPHKLIDDVSTSLQNPPHADYTPIPPDTLLAGTNSTVVLLAKENTWVKIMDSNNTLLAVRQLRAGDTYFVPSQKGIIINSGNPAAIEVMRDGQLSTLDAISAPAATSTTSNLILNALNAHAAPMTPLP